MGTGGAAFDYPDSGGNHLKEADKVYMKEQEKTNVMRLLAPQDLVSFIGCAYADIV